MAASLFLVAACNAGPSKDEFREIRVSDNHSSYIEIRDSDNYTNIVTTTSNTSTTNNNSTTSSSDTSSSGSSSSTDSSSSTPTVQMMNSNLYEMTTAAWAVGGLAIGLRLTRKKLKTCLRVLFKCF